MRIEPRAHVGWGRVAAAFKQSFVGEIVDFLRTFNPARFAGGAISFVTGLFDQEATADLRRNAPRRPADDQAATRNAAGLPFERESLDTGALRDALGGAGQGEASPPQRGEMVVRFENMPRGARVDTRRTENLDIETDVGFSLAGGGL